MAFGEFTVNQHTVRSLWSLSASPKHPDVKRNGRAGWTCPWGHRCNTSAHRRVKGSNIFCSIKICHNFIFVNFLFQPWLVLSFPRCKEEAALLLSPSSLFSSFFHFSFTAQNYLLWWTTKKKKIALQALFWGKARPRKKKGTFFMDWTRWKSASFTCFVFLTQPHQLLKHCEWRISQEPAGTAVGRAESEMQSLSWKTGNLPKICKILKGERNWQNDSGLIFWIQFLLLCRGKKLKFLFSIRYQFSLCRKNIQQNRVPAWKNF